ncbi:PREDICTED: uncharacterized protein LOC105460401 [Wasmannia auropunctata]|uniref:uncharacterized protein LOC105460401 n=1 Tax=Wasmannia auropunctata TaxID=64793 RepID=UPI0005EED060|nr:PREDICTED: uncharacterized protein LOC105460401 [Wasmannia auropunctata]
MWAPVISVVWAIMYMMQRKIMPGNLSQETSKNSKGESNRFVDEEVPVTMGFTRRPARKKAEAHRALELLEDYHAKLTRPQDKQLRLAIERVIRIFKSRLFQALLGKREKFCSLRESQDGGKERDRKRCLVVAFRRCRKSKGIALKLFLFMENPGVKASVIFLIH